MRIESSYHPTLAARAASRPGGAAAAFQLGDASAAREASVVSETSSSPTIDSLLALQSVEDPLLRKKKALRRGAALLDALDAIKADLLAGRIGEGRLNGLMALIGQGREHSDPRIEALLDDIELRARVELAKLGQYPRP